MNLELLILGGYGQFVWPAFIFTFTLCFILYLKTKREYEKQEKRFLEISMQLPIAEVKAARLKTTSDEVFSGISSF